MTVQGFVSSSLRVCVFVCVCVCLPRDALKDKYKPHSSTGREKEREEETLPYKDIAAEEQSRQRSPLVVGPITLNWTGRFSDGENTFLDSSDIQTNSINPFTPDAPSPLRAA